MLTYFLLAATQVSLQHLTLAPAQCPSSYRLTAVRAVALPPSSTSLGPIHAFHGALLLFTLDDSLLVRLSDNGLPSYVALPKGLRPVGQPRATSPASVELVDATGPSLIRLDRDGSVLSRTSLRLPQADHLVDAFFVNGQWLLSYVDTLDARYTVYSYSASTRRLSSVYRSAAHRSTLDVGPHFLTRGTTTLLLANSVAPFTVISFPGVWPAYHSSSLPLIVPPDIPRSLRPHDPWRALSLISLPCGFLRTFADLRSDRRLAVRYNRDGSIANIATLPGPMALIAGSSDTPTILAARRTRRLELVFYTVN